MSERFTIGFDFGVESIRVVVVGIRDGRIAGRSERGSAIAHAQHRLNDAAAACRAALSQSDISLDQIVGIGVACTGGGMMAAKTDGTPVILPAISKDAHLSVEVQQMNEVARARGETWLKRYGGSIDADGFFPGILSILHNTPDIDEATDIWLEAADWFVWQLVDGLVPLCASERLSRSTSHAGFKALWNRQTGYPSYDYFAAVYPKLADVARKKMPGILRSPGSSAGGLSVTSAEWFGLKPGTPVSAAITPAHARLPGAGVASPSTMVLDIDSNSCLVMNSRIEQFPAGISGVVEDGILPGYFGYEARRADVGQSLAWLAGALGLSQVELAQRAAAVPPGSDRIVARDGLSSPLEGEPNDWLREWFNRLSLHTKPEAMYRALIEASAFDLRQTVETWRNAGVPVRRFVAAGKPGAASPLLMQIYADVLKERITIAGTEDSCGVGAAILGCLAAGPGVTGYAQMSQAIHAMARHRNDIVYRPDLAARKVYDELYEGYRKRNESRVAGKWSS